MNDDRHSKGSLLVANFGIVTSVITGLVLAFIEIEYEIALYSLNFWFIIPVGSIGAGFVGASGYYIGAKLFKQKPAGSILLNLAISSLATFLIVYYIPYYMHEIEGQRVKEIISFWQYLNFQITHTSLARLSSTSSSGIKLGSFGYVTILLQLIGFFIGGIYLFSDYLSADTFCEKCSRYLNKINETTRYYESKEFFVHDMEKFLMLIDQKKYRDAVNFHNETMGVPNNNKNQFQTRLVKSKCKGCGVNHIYFMAYKHGTDVLLPIQESELNIFTEEQL